MRPTFDAVTALTDAFCREHLTDEYTQLCRKLAAALARKRPSPLLQGKIQTWACAIVYAIGQNNFLFDKSEEPYMSADELCPPFGISKSTAGAKAKVVRDAVKMGFYDPEWTLPSRIGDNPMAWFIQVDGLIVDARHMPREIQEEAFRKGLIPYLP
ncbi:MAG: hypothetical protein EPO21_22670 [Chloroflexota bacterium]|nr:MAG: hypothetical protein EPO21_22670 [Chloroflexota bacterium]